MLMNKGSMLMIRILNLWFLVGSEMGPSSPVIKMFLHPNENLLLRGKKRSTILLKVYRSSISQLRSNRQFHLIWTTQETQHYATHHISMVDHIQETIDQIQ